jgi:hypothetical protein
MAIADAAVAKNPRREADRRQPGPQAAHAHWTEGRRSAGWIAVAWIKDVIVVSSRPGFGTAKQLFASQANHKLHQRDPAGRG